VENMGLRSILASKWFFRLVIVGWIACAASIIAVFKNMEFIVHGTLYDYGLIFSAEWADSYRVLTWLIYLCVGLPATLSVIALFSSFLKVERNPKLNLAGHRKAEKSRVVTKLGSEQSRQLHQESHVEKPTGEAIRRADNGNCVGISCPECKKVFGRALVMLDFRGGTNRMVSVCPYCNYVLGNTAEEENKDEEFYVNFSEKKIKPHS
jgi:hypothetical protein